MLKSDMLSYDQKNYLDKIPENKIIFVKDFDPQTSLVSEDIISSVRRIYPDLNVIHLGSSALGIAGQNDLDIYAFSKPENFNSFLPGIEKLFGIPLHQHDTFIEWHFEREGFDVEFYLTSPDSKTMKNQKKTFEILKNSPELLKEYESLKKKFNGRSMREYQKQKYIFFNKLLNIYIFH